MNNKIELLAPVGTLDVLKAVISAGADAVYFGGKRFSMRQHGAWLNFTDEDLLWAVDYAHRNGVRAYITLNNLLTLEETEVLAGHLEFLESIRPDAVIVQDLGLLHLMNRLGTDLVKHASTMMNVHHAWGARLLAESGIARIITSRDITIYEAKEISRSTGVEVEYFVHGDMCVAQSSQCFHSGVATDLSANRGKCLKSCRWPWSLVDRKKDAVLAHVEDQYVLARKDLCLYHQLPELIGAGIASLKIEGRARPAEYLQPIVRAYRTAIDRYYDDPFHYRTDFEELNLLRKTGLRDLDANHAFTRPGIGSKGLSGEREPRFFSIAIQERPYRVPVPSVLPAPRNGKSPHPPASKRPELSVRCQTPDQAHRIADSPCDWIYVGGEFFMRPDQRGWKTSELTRFIDLCRERNKKVGVQTPRITTSRELNEIEALVSELSLNPPDEYLVHNVGSLRFIRGLTDVPLHGDFSLNVWNGESARFLLENRISFLTPGIELGLEQVRDLADRTPLPLECLVHGSLPGMILEYCVIGAHLTGTTKFDVCPGPCTRKHYALKDKLGQNHWLEADQYCRNHLYMVNDLCTLNILGRFAHPNIRRLRIEGVLYEGEYLARLVAVYQRALDCLFSRGSVNGEMALLEQEILEGAPRPLTVGAYGNIPQGVSTPLEELPTDLIVRYDP